MKAGAAYPDAAALAVGTSGRTVLLAGLTVCIALLGQLTLGVSFLNGMSIAAAIAVALTMATSLTFLPAMLGFLGPRVLSGRNAPSCPPALASTAPPVSGSAGPGSSSPQSSPPCGAIVVVILIALPIFGLRLGTSDASTDPAGSTTHQAYTALAHGFGPGFNGPLELTGQASSPADVTAFGHLLATAAHTPGVASVTPAATSPNGKVMLATVYPLRARRPARPSAW